MKLIKKWFKSPIHIMMMLVLIAVLGMGTIAYFTDVEAVVNKITMGNISTDIRETVDELTKKNIGVANTSGKLESYVRIRVDIPTITYSYVDENGKSVAGSALIKILPQDEAITAVAWNNLNEISIDQNTVWKKESDGYWYLNRTVQPGEEVLFLTEITYPGLMKDEELALPDGITADMLAIPITSEAVQVIDGVTGAYETFQKVAEADADQ